MKIVRRGMEGFSKEKVRELLLNYPFKGFQQDFQNLDRNVVANFLTDELEKKVQSESAYYWEVVNYDQLLAIFVLEPLGEHSQVYEKKMFRISTLVNYSLPKICFGLFWQEVERLANRQDIEHLSCRVDASDYENISVLNLRGFYFCGLSIKMVLLPKEREPSKIQGFSVRQILSSDLSLVLGIMKEHRFNHYFYDSFLNQDRTPLLFAGWMASAVKNQGHSNNVYVLVNNSDQKVIGFVNYQEPKLFN